MEDNVILLAEDDPNHAALIQRCLLAHNPQCRILHLSDGEQAIAFLLGEQGHRRTRLLLMDLRMPKCDGLEVLRQLKQQAGIKHLPVVILSSSAAERDLRQAYRYCANSYLVKPHDLNSFQALLSMISQYWLESNNPHPELSASAYQEAL